MSGNVNDSWAALGKPRKLDYEASDIKNNASGGDSSANIEDEDLLDSKSVQLEGWVEKQSRYLLSWRHRWLVLRHPHLYTFKSRQKYDDSPTEKINLIGCRVVSDPTWTSQLGPFGFEIETAASSTFAFRIPTRHAKEQWTAALLHAIATGQVPVPNTGSRVVSSGLFRYSGGPPPSRGPTNNSTADEERSSIRRGLSSSPDDVEEAMLQQVLRQSAIEAGIYPENPSSNSNSNSNERILSASTALRIQQDEEYKRTLEEDIRRDREAGEEQYQDHVSETKEEVANVEHGNTDDEKGGGDQKSSTMMMDNDNERKETAANNDSKRQPGLKSATASPPVTTSTQDNAKEEEVVVERVKKSSESKEENKTPSIPMEPEKGPDICTCMIRLPSGKKLLRRFRKDDTIEIIRRYVVQQQEEEGTEACFAPDQFELVSNFPRKEWKNYGLTLAETRLGSNISFFVHIVN